MTSRLGPMEIECDSPPYSIVKACTRIGVHDPEDVRWCRVSGQAETHRLNWRELIRHPWRFLTGGHRAQGKNCVCGHELPQLDQYTFTMMSGLEKSYELGQCIHCRTIYWEET